MRGSPAVKVGFVQLYMHVFHLLRMMNNRVDISDGKELVKIPIENQLDDQNPTHFEYVRVSVPSTSCPLDGFEVQYSGCECCAVSNKAEICLDDFCLCIHQKSCGPSYDICHRLLAISMYNKANKFAKPVFECNSQCLCGSDCHNRVIQTGLCSSLRVVKTKLKGWGLVTDEPILAGTFVCEYAGEILTRAEAKERMAMLKPTDCNYIIAVHEHLASGQTLSTYVDPVRIGNVGRFANHSCDPNLTMFPVRIDNAVPKLALFATRDIQPSEELCFDYSGSGEQDVADCRGDVVRKPCYCGTMNCRRFLPFDDKLFDD